MTMLMAVVANVQELAPCAGRRLPASQAGRFAFLPHCSSFGSDQRLSDCLEWPMGALEGDIVRRGRSGPCLVVGLAWGVCEFWAVAESTGLTVLTSMSSLREITARRLQGTAHSVAMEVAPAKELCKRVWRQNATLAWRGWWHLCHFARFHWSSCGFPPPRLRNQWLATERPDNNILGW